MRCRVIVLDTTGTTDTFYKREKIERYKEYVYKSKNLWHVSSGQMHPPSAVSLIIESAMVFLHATNFSVLFGAR